MELYRVRVPDQGTLAVAGPGVVAELVDGTRLHFTADRSAEGELVEVTGYRLPLVGEIVLPSGDSEVRFLTLTAQLTGDGAPDPSEALTLAAVERSRADNRARWNRYLAAVVRFDGTTMLENGPRAWSMDQESVDLNSYLYREKLALRELAVALERPQDAARWGGEAVRLRTQIGDAMFDDASGWFYDVHYQSGEIVPVQGPEGWIPLWTGVATESQAARVRESMLDPNKFRTRVPFPTVARDDPEFSDGYWRGLVWLDQAYFAIEGLCRYGYHDDAEELTDQLFRNLEGATTPGMALRENYRPLTGEGANVSHFSWTAAHLLLLTQPDG